jgi:hypothetical protein
MQERLQQLYPGFSRLIFLNSEFRALAVCVAALQEIREQFQT